MLIYNKQIALCRIPIKRHWPWCNFSFMTECRLDVNKLECGSSRKRVGQVWLEIFWKHDWFDPHLSRCLVKKPPWCAFPDNWVRFQQAAGTRFSLWQSYRWPINWVSCSTSQYSNFQGEDFHLDHELYVACRKDRESVCSEVQAGQGRVYHCLTEHKDQVWRSG